MAGCPGTILVVDDEESIRDYLSEVLRLEGYQCQCFQESISALAYLSRGDAYPDLVLTDIRMPGPTGLDLLKSIRVLSPCVPVILISGVYELAIALEALKEGAADYLFKPARPAEILAVVSKHIGGPRPPARHAVQDALAAFLTSFEPQDKSTSASPTQERARALFQVLGFNRHETMWHSLRVAAFALLLGRQYGLSSAQLRDLELGALLHDIGKLGIPSNVILKPGPLTPREWEVMRTHPRIGFQLLAGQPNVGAAGEIVYGHHERYDGNGYPRGLKGDQIPIGSRLFSIVDTLDALISKRPYRAAQGLDVARRVIEQDSGAQFDPSAVEAFLRIADELLLAVPQQFPDPA